MVLGQVNMDVDPTFRSIAVVFKFETMKMMMGVSCTRNRVIGRQRGESDGWALEIDQRLEGCCRL